MYAFNYSSIIVQGREILLNIFIIDFIIYFFIFIIYSKLYNVKRAVQHNMIVIIFL